MADSSEIARLVDEAAIRRLVAFYCDAVNHRDPERAATVYAEDGCLSADGTDFVGRAVVAGVLGRLLVQYEFAHQIAHAALIEVDGDRATARWSIVEINSLVTSPGLSFFLGTYEDELVRLPEGWRFKRRTLHTIARSLLDPKKLKAFPEFRHVLQFGI
jgi:uncharacterized protein (TIGR02246 family)